MPMTVQQVGTWSGPQIVTASIAGLTFMGAFLVAVLNLGRRYEGQVTTNNAVLKQLAEMQATLNDFKKLLEGEIAKNERLHRALIRAKVIDEDGHALPQEEPRRESAA
jgi:hypothetical protein